MTYAAFDKTKPDAAVDDGADFGANTKNNLLALRDGAILGIMPGWAYSYTGTDAGLPATVVWSMGTERLQETYTWGTGGDLTKVAYRYSANSGTTYEALDDTSGNFVMSLTYDGTGNLTATSWGTST